MSFRPRSKKCLQKSKDSRKNGMKQGKIYTTCFLYLWSMQHYLKIRLKQHFNFLLILKRKMASFRLIIKTLRTCISNRKFRTYRNLYKIQSISNIVSKFDIEIIDPVSYRNSILFWRYFEKKSKFKIRNSKFKIQTLKFKLRNSNFEIQTSKFKLKTFNLINFLIKANYFFLSLIIHRVF